MKTIMLVDDVEISNFITRKMIEKVAVNAEVSDFTQPEKAYQSLLGRQPDMIFLDLNMPEIDGWKFLDMMMQDKLDSTPVFILTSSTSELDLQRSKNYNNVKQFLIKPLNTHLLTGILAEEYMTCEI